MPSCERISAITGFPHSGANSLELVSGSLQTSRANSMIAVWRPRQIPKNGSLCSRDQRIASSMPSMPRTPNPPGTSSPSYPASSSAVVSWSVKRSDAIHWICTPVSFAIPPWTSASCTLLAVGELGVLAHHGDPHLLRRMEDLVHHPGPGAQVGLFRLEVQPPADLSIESLLVELERDLVDRFHVGTLDHAAEVDVTELRDLALQVFRQRPLGAAD